MALHVSSNAFSEGQPIPEKYTCDGQNVSPPLKWSGVPQNTKSVAIIADDPDAPSGTFTHWGPVRSAGQNHRIDRGIVRRRKSWRERLQGDRIWRSLPSGEQRAPLFLPCLRARYRVARQSQPIQTGRYRRNEGTHSGRRSSNGHIQEKAITSTYLRPTRKRLTD